MSHATEGELHAHLDGALSAIDPAAAARLAEHLDRCADCRARLDEERAIRACAADLLAAALPSVEEPPFEAVARPAGRPLPSATTHRFMWAASLVVALGAGWMGHALLGGHGDIASSELDGIAQTGSEEKEDRAVGRVSAFGEKAAAPAPEAAAAPEAGAPRDGITRNEIARTNGDWRAVSLEEAERWIATRVLRVPDLEITAVEAAAVEGRRVIRMRQALPGGGVLELVQEAESGREAAKAARPPSTLSVRIGGAWVRVSAPVASDSLRALVSRIR